MFGLVHGHARTIATAKKLQARDFLVKYYTLGSKFEKV